MISQGKGGQKIAPVDHFPTTWAVSEATQQRARSFQHQYPVTPGSSPKPTAAAPPNPQLQASGLLPKCLGPPCLWVLRQHWARAALASEEPPRLACSALPGPEPSKSWGTTPSTAGWPSCGLQGGWGGPAPFYPPQVPRAAPCQVHSEQGSRLGVHSPV